MTTEQAHAFLQLFTSFGQILGSLTENLKNAPEGSLKYNYQWFTRLHTQALADYDKLENLLFPFSFSHN